MPATTHSTYLVQFSILAKTHLFYSSPTIVSYNMLHQPHTQWSIARIAVADVRGILFINVLITQPQILLDSGERSASFLYP